MVMTDGRSKVQGVCVRVHACMFVYVCVHACVSVFFLCPGDSDSRKHRNSTGSTMTLEVDYFYLSFLHNFLLLTVRC